MDPDKNSFRSRGRIAQVLAQARASLKEPSRPYTPASLDNRSSSLDRDQLPSSQDHLNFDQGFGSSFYSKENNPLKQGSSTSQTSQSSQSDGAKDKYIDAKASIKIDPNMMMSAAASAGLGIFGSSTLVKSNLLAKEKERNNIVSSIVNDISECVQGLESELSTLKKLSSNTSSSSSSSSSNLENAGKICESVFVNCDKLCKQIKESDSLSTSALKEIVSISRSISAIVTAVIKHAESSDPDSRVWYEMKHRSICGVAKLALLLIQKDNLLSSTVNLAIYKECCYSLYQAMKFINDIKSIDDIIIISGGGGVSNMSSSRRSISTSSSSSNNIGRSSIDSIGGSIYEDLDDVSPDVLRASGSQTRATSVKSNSSHSLSDLTRSELEEFKISIESRSVDVILMLFQLFQNKFTTEFTKEIDVERRSMKKENSYPQNDESKPEQQNTEDGLTCFKVILEATIIASAYIRNLSNQDSVRKRLVRYGVVNDGISPSIRVLVSGVQSVFQAFENSAYSSGKAGTSSAIQSQSQAITADNQFKTSSNILKLVSKVLIQLVASIRNFSLDQLGRNQILAAKGICHVCTIIRLFPHVPDLLLNCVRVTAKLSLLEPFRTQMNSKSVYIKYIVEVVIREAMQCEKIMEGSGGHDEKSADGEDSDDEYGDTSWPEWFTWPILSRSAFTLGNLTTSNNSNRLLIAVECKCLKPLTMLLQACACTVAELSKRRSEKSMQKQRDSLDGFEGKDGDNEGNEDREQDVLFVDADGRKSGGGGEGDYYDEEFERKKSSIEEENDENFALGEDDQRDRHNNMDYDSAEHEILDATVKLLRLLANISIEPSVGQLLSRRIEPFQMLVEMLASSIHYEEFLLNVVAASTNLTYYSCNFSTASSDSDPKMSSTLVSMAVQLSHCLFHENSELVLESARALGNLTRRPAVLVVLQQHRVDLALVLLLGHQNMDVVVAAAGAIVNLTADAKCKISLMSMQSNPSYELIKVLKRSSLKNLTLSTLIAQSFHNLLALGTPEEVRSSFMSTLPSSVQDTFLELVDLVEDLMAESDQEYKNDQSYQAFVKVGRAILQLLE